MLHARNSLTHLNERFYQEHHHLAQAILKNILSVVIYKEGVLSLWANNATNFFEKENVLSINDQYDIFKEISHLPVLLLTIVQNQMMQNDDLTFYSEVQKILVLLQQIRNDISNLFLPVYQENQYIIVDRSIDILELLMTTKDENIINKIIKNYLDELKPFLEYNKAKATEFHLENLHRIITNWQEAGYLQLTKSRILIVGRHGPREGRIEMQYFMKLYKEIGLHDVYNDFLYYVEALPTHMDKIDILNDIIITFLGGAEVNKHIGKVVLGSRKGMFSDLLHAFSEPILNELI